jgi:hypothetical protein
LARGGRFVPGPPMGRHAGRDPPNGPALGPPGLAGGWIAG